ncbi:MAG: arabinose efflux permease family protein, partial [Microbacteriaceae bacterium]|nr:arabinose efflux permease family protein [Microbacteriaceae bacterium]
SHGRGRLLPRGVLPVLPLYLGIGLVFAAVDVSAVAVAKSIDAPVLAGLLVAGFAAGSVVGGLLFGPISAHWAPARRVLAAGLAFAVVVPFLLLPTVTPVLAIVMFAAGLVTAPVLIASSSFIESSTERHRLTEALTWPSIGLSAGVTVGATLAGIRIDADGPYSGFLLAAVGAAVVGVGAIVGALLRRTKARRAAA